MSNTEDLSKMLTDRGVDAKAIELVDHAGRLIDRAADASDASLRGPNAKYQAARNELYAKSGASEEETLVIIHKLVDGARETYAAAFPPPKEGETATAGVALTSLELVREIESEILDLINEPSAAERVKQLVKIATAAIEAVEGAEAEATAAAIRRSNGSVLGKTY